MKITLLAILVLAANTAGFCQEVERPYLSRTEAPRLHFTMAGTETTGRVELTAFRADRDLDPHLDLSSANTSTILQLRGDVEVTLCSPGQHGCDRGSLLLRADSVDYDEKTGELNAVGGVRIGPYRNQPDNSSR